MFEKLKPLYRYLRVLLVAGARGVGIRNKLICICIILKSTSKFLPSASKTLLQWFTDTDGLLTFNCTGSHIRKLTVTIRENLDADCFIAYEFLTGFYPPPTGTPKLIIDGGSNIGLFLLHASNAFPKVPVICYEPDQKNLEVLRLNASRNGLAPDIRSRGVWSRSMDGYYHPKTAFDGYISEDPSPYPVRCEVPPIQAGTWLKLDVEGAEYEVLPAVLASHPLPQWISMEIHDWTERGGSLLSLLKDKGYRCEVLTDNSPNTQWAAVTANLDLPSTTT